MSTRYSIAQRTPLLNSLFAADIADLIVLLCEAFHDLKEHSRLTRAGTTGQTTYRAGQEAAAEVIVDTSDTSLKSAIKDLRDNYILGFREFGFRNTKVHNLTD